MIGTWNKPSEIEKEVNIIDLTAEDLYFYHDQMHIFWKKVEDGFVIGWTFREIFSMHKNILIELFKRKLKHLSPINSLDKIDLVNSKKELIDLVSGIIKR